MAAYYNEIDPKAAAWLRELIRAGHIAPGEVDSRSIVDVQPDELESFAQCHFFAGIGVWSYALRRAGWSDDRPVWTGSCPCQPFSAAGKGEGLDDSRHLWPHWFRLIRERRPVAVFGEQVASKDGLAWLDLVHADLEGEAYTVGAVDTCSAGFGSPNIRQRLYWVADTDHAERRPVGAGRNERNRPHTGRPEDAGNAQGRGALDGMADAANADRWPRERGAEAGTRPNGERRRGSSSRGDPGRLADADGRGEHGLGPQDRGSGGMGDAQGRGCEERRHAPFARGGGHADGADALDEPGPANGFWRAADWLCCTDGRWRPVEPGTFPLVTGAPERLVRLRGYGNAVNAEVATGFVGAYLDVISGPNNVTTR